MSKPNAPAPLVVAASDVDEEMRGYADLAREATRIPLDGEKALSRVARLLNDATERQERVHGKVRALVTEIEQIRQLEERSLTTLVEVARELETRTAQFRQWMTRFAELGETAKTVHAMAGELAAKKEGGAADGDLVAGLRELEARMMTVVDEAQLLSRDAGADQWPEIARQADAVRQQMHAAKNKLSLAHRTIAARAPS